MHQSATQSNLQNDTRWCVADQSSVQAGLSADVVTAESLTRKRSHSTAITIAAIIIAAGNFLTFVSLPWTQHTLLRSVNPAYWMCLGLLFPGAVLSISLYRSYWLRRESGQNADQLGPYLLKQKLGSGGMGDVYLAEHQLMKRHCAVKLIHPENAGDMEMRKSFEQEAKATAQLTHWNTVEIYDYGTSSDGRFYYVMEYLNGFNLSEFIRKHGRMSPGRVVYLLKQLCDALYEADCSGLVHRDIKPSNIFLTERGKSCDVVKLLDFGLVQSITRSPVTLRNVSTRIFGSPSYMCPEQAVGMKPDSRGDLYSLGAVAYFLLTGRPPFLDENPIMLIVAHATVEVPTFQEIGADVPQDLANVVLRCLSRNPAERFGSARELREALETCECANDWGWRSAEDWWNQHRPQDVHEITLPGDNREDTSPIAANTSTIPPDAHTRIDHEEPTLIIDRPAELECAASW